MWIEANRLTLLALTVSWFVPVAPAMAAPTSGQSGSEIVGRICVACHQIGVMGAPKLGDSADWAPRIVTGRDTLVDHAMNGFGQMPARGGDSSLTDTEVARAVDYILESARQGTAAVTTIAANTAQKNDARDKTRRDPVASENPPATLPAAPAVSAGPAAAPPPPTRIAAANRFNRLMKPPSDWNLPPTRDGIHDPSSVGVAILQSPKDAFDALPKTNSGNRVDWVAALDAGQITPRFDKLDPEIQPAVFDFNVVREVKGTMPNVVYPHKQHTKWLDCSNCHPAIFIPQKGANQISMASILMGQQCGVCHGKVAFPVSDCRRCHSGEKMSKAGQ